MSRRSRVRKIRDRQSAYHEAMASFLIDRKCPILAEQEFYEARAVNKPAVFDPDAEAAAVAALTKRHESSHRVWIQRRGDKGGPA